MSAIAGSVGIIGAIIIGVLVVVVSILAFLMPIYVYAINTKMCELRVIQKSMLKQQSMIADSVLRIAVNSYTNDNNEADSSSNNVTIDILTDISNATTRNTSLLQDFLSRLES